MPSKVYPSSPIHTNPTAHSRSACYRGRGSVPSAYTSRAADGGSCGGWAGHSHAQPTAGCWLLNVRVVERISGVGRTTQAFRCRPNVGAAAISRRCPPLRLGASTTSLLRNASSVSFSAEPARAAECLRGRRDRVVSHWKRSGVWPIERSTSRHATAWRPQQDWEADSHSMNFPRNRIRAVDEVR